jgi:signal transduction histidine kinase
VFRTTLRRVRGRDLALTAAFVAFALLEEFVVRMPGAWWPYALALFTLLIAARRIVPLAGLLASIVTTALVAHDNEPTTFRLWQLFAMMISAYSVGVLVPPGGEGWRARLRGGVGVALVLATALAFWNGAHNDPMGALFFPMAPYVVGIVVAVQGRRLADAAAARAAVREQRAREAVMEERVRIARELHDMVAHSVTVMVIQAGAVRRRLGSDQAVERELLESVESSGRDAVTELRRTLGLLRGEGGDANAAPVGLDRLDELVGQVRDAGLAVTVHRSGEPVALLPAVDLSAYRIAQEALTNVLRHAGPAQVEVGLVYRPDGLHLSVVNGPSPDGRRPVAGAGGHGVIGMRERVALFGGEFAAGPRPEGGFAVTARLPVAA